MSIAQTSLIESAEYLRLALPLMAKHDLPVTPPNYAVWYAYVSGTNQLLKTRLDERINTGNKVSQALMETLYLEYLDVHFELSQLEDAQQTITTINENVTLALETAVDSSSDFTATLNGYSERVNAKPDQAEFSLLVEELSYSTRSMAMNNRQLLDDLQQAREEVNILQRQLKEVRQQAKTDSLTSLANRKAFFDHCDDMYRSGIIPRGKFSLFMIDIDFFKNINDTFGHLFGDKVIQAIGKVLKNNTKGKDMAARFGGEEFVVLLADTGLKGALAVAEGIRRTVEGARIINPMNKKIISKVTISIGVTEFLSNDTLEDVLARADKALYCAKNAGRNLVMEAETGTISLNTLSMEMGGDENRYVI